MAEMTRNPNYLQRHRTLENRVRNLETGVHPTAGDVNFFDSTDWRPATIVAGFQPWIQGVDTFALQYRKRVGIVTLAGGVSNSGGTDESWPAGDQIVVANIPDPFRPNADMTFMAMTAVNNPIPLVQVNILTNGDVVVRDTAGALQTGTREGLRFDGITYIPGDD